LFLSFPVDTITVCLLILFDRSSTPLGRSSHGISVIHYATDNPKVIMYGGENKPRTPIDSTLHVLSSLGIEYKGNVAPQEWETVTVKNGSNIPPGRIAHAQAVMNDVLYIFGGRLGPSMNEEALGDLWRFDWSTKTWEEVTCAIGVPPEARSFHKLISAGGLLYVFGGCGVKGRLNDLHSFDPGTSTWTKLPSCDSIAGRGGACFQSNGAGTALYVISGFIGHETRDVHRYDVVSTSWTKLEDFPDNIPARSVTAGCIIPNLDIICLFGGELEPSSRGHEGAGNFSNDVLYLDTSITDAKFVSRATPINLVSEKPSPRGWLESSLLRSNDGTADVVIFGGLSGNDISSTRNDDTWILHLSKK